MWDDINAESVIVPAAFVNSVSFTAFWYISLKLYNYFSIVKNSSAVGLW